MGKSTMVRWLLGEWAKAGTRCGLIAVEEGRQKIAGNYISSEASMENHIVAYRDWGAPEWEEATNAVSSMVGRPLFCVDSAFKLEEVSAAFERLATEKKCQVIAVDHIHLIRMDKAGETEQREIKDISARIKELTKRFNVVGIALAQLHRPADKSRIPVPPTLTDLRASGAIEEHCDSAMFIHREDYYRRGESKTNECNIGIEKNRNGRTGNCTLRAELQYQRFSDAMQPMENT
jgi:replicative DNA helicase